MESNKIMVIVIAVLLAAVAVEGAFLVVNSNKTETSNDDYSELEDKINELNNKGGRIYYSNGNYNDITAGANLVSISGSCIHVKAHGSFYEEVAPISGISCIRIYS